MQGFSNKLQHILSSWQSYLQQRKQQDILCLSELQVCRLLVHMQAPLNSPQSLQLCIDAADRGLAVQCMHPEMPEILSQDLGQHGRAWTSGWRHSHMMKQSVQVLTLEGCIHNDSCDCSKLVQNALDTRALVYSRPVPKGACSVCSWTVPSSSLTSH